MAQRSDDPVWVLAGPTAAGKTAAALALAERTPIEIISMDSALVYRGMDIGTAKPSAAERAAVPHHLIDIRDPLDAYSAAAFAVDAGRLIADIRARGRRPLLVGGTMLYLRALQQGLDELPPADPAVRTAIEARARERGWAAMHAELAAVDPATAARLQPGDSQRIQRALEVWTVSGRPLSAHFGARRPASGPPLRLLSLEPSDRAWLHERIALRFDRMLEQGFLDEVRALRARGDLDHALPSIRAVGYRQAWDHLDGVLDAAAFRAAGIAATRQLAKRQLTWLRGMAERLVIDCCAADAAARAVDQLLRG